MIRPVRRAARILLNVLTWLSALLAVAAVADWPESYVRFWVVVFGGSPDVGVTSSHGGIYLYHDRHDFQEEFPPHGWLFQHGTYDDPFREAPEVGLCRVAVNRWQPLRQFTYAFGGRTMRFVVVPHWTLAAVFAVCPAVRVRRWARRHARVRTGHCRACGYDLRATPERCPECGRTAVP
jgi:hypothetical protein